MCVTLFVFVSVFVFCTLTTYSSFLAGAGRIIQFVCAPDILAGSGGNNIEDGRSKKKTKNLKNKPENQKITPKSNKLRKHTRFPRDPL